MPAETVRHVAGWWLRDAVGSGVVGAVGAPHADASGERLTYRIEQAEDFYARRGVPTRFQITSGSVSPTRSTPCSPNDGYDEQSPMSLQTAGTAHVVDRLGPPPPWVAVGRAGATRASFDTWHAVHGGDPRAEWALLGACDTALRVRPRGARRRRGGGGPSRRRHGLGGVVRDRDTSRRPGVGARPARWSPRWLTGPPPGTPITCISQVEPGKRRGMSPLRAGRLHRTLRISLPRGATSGAARTTRNEYGVSPYRLGCAVPPGLLGVTQVLAFDPTDERTAVSGAGGRRIVAAFVAVPAACGTRRTRRDRRRHRPPARWTRQAPDAPTTSSPIIGAGYPWRPRPKRWARPPMRRFSSSDGCSETNAASRSPIACVLPGEF